VLLGYGWCWLSSDKVFGASDRQVEQPKARSESSRGVEVLSLGMGRPATPMHKSLTLATYRETCITLHYCNSFVHLCPLTGTTYWECLQLHLVNDESLGDIMLCSSESVSPQTIFSFDRQRQQTTDTLKV
jgi:hypothetical protein